MYNVISVYLQTMSSSLLRPVWLQEIETVLEMPLTSTQSVTK